SSAAAYARIYVKPRIGIGWGLSTETSQHNATWRRCIFAEKVSHPITFRQLNGFGRQPKVVIRPLRKTLPGCTSPEPVYLWTIPELHSGYKWPLRKGMHVHNWTWLTSTSKEKEFR